MTKTKTLIAIKKYMFMSIKVFVRFLEHRLVLFSFWFRTFLKLLIGTYLGGAEAVKFLLKKLFVSQNNIKLKSFSHLSFNIEAF